MAEFRGKAPPGAPTKGGPSSRQRQQPQLAELLISRADRAAQRFAAVRGAAQPASEEPAGRRTEPPAPTPGGGPRCQPPLPGAVQQPGFTPGNFASWLETGKVEMQPRWKQQGQCDRSRWDGCTVPFYN